MRVIASSPFICVILAVTMAVAVDGFGLNQVTKRRSSQHVKSLRMGIFDSIMKAFENTEYSSPPEGIKATARHILVKTKDEVDLVLDQLRDGKSFGSVAADFSTCPSKSQGGSLGSFAPGTMVQAFNDVVFDPETKLGEVVGPVQTQFGYHLIVVDKRTGV